MVNERMTTDELERKAKNIRKDIVGLVFAAKSGHLGGSLSFADVLVVLYNNFMNIDLNNPVWEDRDRFVMSKGHCTPVLYTVLSDVGFFSKDLLFQTYRKLNSKFQGHPDKEKTPGVDMTTGSLGVGLSAAAGIALGAKIQGKNYRVYVAIGDGEMNEGQIWEAAASSAHFKLDNLIAFIDANGYQNDGDTHLEMNMEQIDAKWKAFGWNTYEKDGNNVGEISDAIKQALKITGRPSVIICRTIKGKGVSFMENNNDFHGKCPSEDEYQKAMLELS
jgi:transketolase